MDPESRLRGFGPECWGLVCGSLDPDSIPGQISIFDLWREQNGDLPDMSEEVQSEACNVKVQERSEDLP